MSQEFSLLKSNIYDPKVKSKSHSAVSNCLRLHGLFSLWNYPGQNTGVGSLFFFRGSSQPRDQTEVFSISGGFFCQLSHQGSPRILDRNGMDLTEAEDIQKRWQEYTEGLYKKDLHDTDNHDGLITNLEPDILEYEVKWALESITMNRASGADGIPLELFQILKDDAVKVLHSICQKIWKSQQWPQDQKRSVFIPIPKKGNTK